MENEIWKEINGYEGIFQISDNGKVKSLYGRKPRIRKPYKKENGYLSISLSKGGVSKTFYIHRLVAEAFIPNPENLPQVNHKDENKTNNNVNNLEWCTALYNLNYGTYRERVSNSKTNNPKVSKKVMQFDLEGNFVSEYPSVKETSRQTGFIHQNIQACCKEKSRMCNSYIFLYKKDFSEEYLKKRIEKTKEKRNVIITKDHRDKIVKKLINGKRSKPVLQYTKSGEFVKEWPSMKEAERETGIKESGISCCCIGYSKSSGGYIWKYK